jgi:hypothetical protein
MRRTYGVTTIERRHPRLFSKLIAASRLELWPTMTDGTHLVAVHPKGAVRQLGVLWS